MSTQKLLAEAEKLLERGKTAEAIEKLKSCIATEPNNQLAVNRLAHAYMSLGEEAKAVDTLAQFARKMATAGKPQVAVAIYKQALDIAPQNTNLIQEFAFQCEEAGKLSEASTQAQKLLSYYLPRKKFFDALNIFPLLARISQKDDNIKTLWIQAMRSGLAELKLIHLLVAVLGPPGLNSEEFQTGGDPSTVTPQIYSALEDLLDWFPRDPKLPYALAWGAYKRGDLKSAYRYLHEAIRRDPDFSLAPLLFARILAENQKLNECLFVFKHAKDRIVTDKQVDARVLAQQFEAFEQKNGWIAFSDGDTELTAEDFKNNFFSPKNAEPVTAGDSTSQKDTEPKVEEPQENEEINLTPPVQNAAPFEVELGGGNKSETNSPSPPPQPEPMVEAKEVVAPEPPVEPRPETKELSPLDLIERTAGQVEPNIEQEEKTEIFSREMLKNLVQEAAPEEPALPVQEEEKTEIISREALKEISQISIEPEPTKEDESLLEEMMDSQTVPQPDVAELTQAISLTEIKPEPEAAAVVAPLEPILSTEEKPAQQETIIPSLVETKPALQEQEKKIENSSVSVPIDLGDDLLEEPTITTSADEVERTKHLVEAIKEKASEPEEQGPNAEDFLQFAENYLAKKNYYMARKSLRHALATGGNEALIKAKLREIRRLELPDSLYASASNDEPVESIESVLARLEKEFHLEVESPKSAAIGNVEALLGANDEKTLMDLGVGFIEMGMFQEAGKIFEKLTQSEDETISRGAIYLLATTKYEDSDYGGAVGELKRLIGRPGGTRSEKLSVYYALGEAFEKMRKNSESKKYFKLAAEIDANYRKLKDKLDEKDL